ncbi:MAG: hypothetical protein ACLQBK_14700 [Candidatus Sulfotelmatobacter sp.]
MFQPHSFLWHYLWVAPNLLLAVLASILWKRGLHKEYRGFYIYAWFEAVQWAVLYPMDLIPSVSAVDYLRIYWCSVLLESIILFVLISEIFAEVFGSYAALARVGRLLIRWGGAFLLITATLVAARAPIDNRIWLASTSQIMLEAMYIVVTGLVVLLFVSAAYFRLAWNPRVFGIALGLGISGCVHLATWAVRANFGAVRKSNLLDLANLATSHIVVLMWYYYLLVPQKAATKSVVALPENNLVVWNRELERLLQQRPLHQ